MKWFEQALSPKPWLILAVLLNLSGVADGFPTALSLESLVTLAVLLTTASAIFREPSLMDKVEAKVAVAFVLLIGLVPAMSSLAGSSDLRVLAHPGYRHLMKFLLVAACWTITMKNRRDAHAALDSLLAGYVLLGIVALYRFLVLEEIDLDTFRMALNFRHGDPNFLCLHMASGVALACWRLSTLGTSFRDRLATVGLFLTFGIFGLTAWYTTSRGGLLALIFELVLILGLLPSRWTRLARFAVLAAICAGLLYTDGERLTDRLEFTQDASAEGRIAAFGAGWLGLTASPFFGVGFDGASSLVRQVGTAFHFVSIEGGITIHNTFLQIAAELGFFGVTVYLACLVFLIAAIRRAYQRGELKLAAVASAWLAAVLFDMSGLPLAYNATLLGSLLLMFTALRTVASEQRAEVSG